MSTLHINRHDTGLGKALLWFLLLLTAGGLLGAQCPPKTLPYFESFETHPYVQMYDTLATNGCWRLFRSDPWACSYQYDVLWSSIAGGDNKFIQLECGFMFCDNNQNGYIDNVTRYQHTAVSPPLAEAPVRIRFQASNHTYDDDIPVHLIIGYINNINSIAGSFVAFDTMDIPVDGFNVFHQYSLIVPNTIETPCYIGFRLDTNLQRTEHPGTDINNIYYSQGIGPKRVFNDFVFLDDFEFIPRKHIYYKYYDTICKGESYSGYGFDVEAGHAADLHERDSADACSTWHHRLYLCEIVPTTEEYHFEIEQGDTAYVGELFFTKAGDYTYEYLDRYGCDSTLVVHVSIKNSYERPVYDTIEANWDFWFPNAFTPGEKTNNRFGCFTTLELSSYELTIYTRSGLLVFRSSDPAETWDGTHNGTPLPQGAYTYHCRLALPTGHSTERVGSVLLLR